MQHEYLHVAFNYNGFSAYEVNQEVACYKTNQEQMIKWGLKVPESFSNKLTFYQNQLGYGSLELHVDYSRTIRQIRPW